MVKLLRFKYADPIDPAIQVIVHGQDVRGFGKQPITIAPYSSIALKNYNIKLIAQLSDMQFIVEFGDDITFHIDMDGIALEPLLLPNKTYTFNELRRQLELCINSLTGQNVPIPLIVANMITIGYFTEVILQEPEASLTINTYVYPVTKPELSSKSNLQVRFAIPDQPTLSENVYDCTSAYISSTAIINSGNRNPLVAVTPSIFMLGGDAVSFTIVSPGTINPFTGEATGSFYYSASNNGRLDDVSIWGIAFDKVEYKYANNSTTKDKWNVLVQPGGLALVPTIGDIVTVVRSGPQINIQIIRGGAFIFPVAKVVNIDPVVFSKIDKTKYNYAINTTGLVIVSQLYYPMSSFSNNIPETTAIQCESLSLGQQLGFPSQALIVSVSGTPAVITLNKAAGGVNYEGIMVCINGLDLETYDFATTAEGKTNFLYTIQKEPDNNPDYNITSASGDLTNEPYIDMNNQSSMNINNKLSIFFIDTASSRKLQFTYADLLVIIR